MNTKQTLPLLSHRSTYTGNTTVNSGQSDNKGRMYITNKNASILLY